MCNHFISQGKKTARHPEMILVVWSIDSMMAVLVTHPSSVSTLYVPKNHLSVVTSWISGFRCICVLAFPSPFLGHFALSTRTIFEGWTMLLGIIRIILFYCFIVYMEYIIFFGIFDCSPAVMFCVFVCVDLWKSRSWPEGCFWSLRGIGHIQFVLLNGSFCESTPNLLIFLSVSCHNDDRMQRSFVLLGWHMLNFAPPACYRSLSLSVHFSLSFFSTFGLYFAFKYWVLFSGLAGSCPPHCHH